MSIPAWAIDLVSSLARVIGNVVTASTQEEIDRAFEDAAESIARAKIQRERDGQPPA